MTTAAPTTRRAALALPAALLGGGALLGACQRTAPILPPVGDEFAGRATLAQRADQVRAAAASLGWRTDQRGPGFTRAIYDARSHRAVVDITYDPQRFQIRYNSSENLNYDGTSIHRNYNTWVRNLEDAIIRQSGGVPPRRG